jgi:hypothetical protein
MITTSTMMQSTPAAAPAAMRISGSREDVARTTHDDCGTVVDSALLADNDVSMTEADDSAFSNVDVVAITGVGETTAAGVLSQPQATSVQASSLPLTLVTVSAAVLVSMMEWALALLSTSLLVPKTSSQDLLIYEVASR